MIIAPGKYAARAVEAVMGYTQSDTEQVCVCLEFTDEVNRGQRANWYGVFSEKNGRKVLEQLGYCGWKGDWEGFAGLSDNEVSVTVEEDRDTNGAPKLDRNNVPYTRIAWINPAGGASLKKKMDPAQTKTFAARMRGMVVEVLGNAPAQRAPAAPPRQNGARPPQPVDAYEPDEVDQIPF